MQHKMRFLCQNTSVKEKKIQRAGRNIAGSIFGSLGKAFFKGS